MEVRADTDVEVATTAVDRHNSPSASLLDALDHDLAMETDIASGLGDRAPVDPAPRNLQITPAGMVSCHWTRSTWSPSSREGRVS